jgi:hypothetical protein
VKILVEDSNAKLGRVFSDQKLGMRMYVRIMMLMVLEK